MAGAKIAITDEDVLGALSRLIAAGGDMKGALQNVGEYERRSTLDRIEAGIEPSGKPFAPLNPVYAAAKKGPGILREKGDLAGSIVYQLAGDDAVEIGTDHFSARVHQFGATIVPKTASALVFSLGGKTVKVASVTVPARPMFGISEDDSREILLIFGDFYEAAIGDGADRD